MPKFPSPPVSPARHPAGMTKPLLFAAALLVLTLGCDDGPTAPSTYQRTCLAWSDPETLTVVVGPPGTTATMRRCLLLGR